MKLPYVVSFVVFATLVVLVVVLGLVWSIPDLPASFERSICLPKILSDGSRSEELHCGEMSDVIRVYLKTATDTEYNKVKKNYTEERNKLHRELPVKLNSVQSKRWRKPAARLIGTALPQPRPGDVNASMVPIREWRHDHYSHYGGFLRHGVQYRNGRLVVPVTGTYNVYSFLDMRESHERSNSAPSSRSTDSIQHAVFKFNIQDGRETELVSAVQPHLQSDTGLSTVYSSYLSSILELKRGDELAVKCSNVSYLQSPKHNYFGMHLL